MSLPDTLFIFVLALIIFGPKKLPEIGRQIGKLVGEFRRASNEFKFQIEEELRNVDIIEKPSSRTPIAASIDTTTAEPSSFVATSDLAQDPAANLPVGQHPNIDTLDTAELNSSDMKAVEPDNTTLEAAKTEPATTPTITPAEGAEARTSVPHAATPVNEAEIAAPFPEPHAPVIGHPVPAEAEITHG